MPQVVRRMRPEVAAQRAASAKSTQPTRINVEKGAAKTTTQMKDRHGVYSETDQSDELMTRKFTQDDPAAYVRVGAGLTINLGDYESLRIDCSVTLPCHRGELDAAYAAASDYVADKLTQEQANWTGTAKHSGKAER